MEWEGFIHELEEDERSDQAESLEKGELHLSLQDLSEDLPCGTIGTVSVSKHVARDTGREVWKVDKVRLNLSLQLEEPSDN